MTDRYDGKPFLRLLDSYVLDAIGHLDEANRKWLTASEPHFRETFGPGDTWQAIVAQRMKFGPQIPAAIREIWEKGRVKFVDRDGTEPDPVQFTQTFVDTKFPH